MFNLSQRLPGAPGAGTRPRQGGNQWPITAGTGGSAGGFKYRDIGRFPGIKKYVMPFWATSGYYQAPYYSSTNWK